MKLAKTLIEVDVNLQWLYLFPLIRVESLWMQAGKFKIVLYCFQLDTHAYTFSFKPVENSFLMGILRKI
jgi:hypothetical protein